MTGQAPYELAMDILALRFPDGDIPASCDDMTGRALGLINLLITENAFLDARLKKSDPAVVPITALSDEIGQSAEIVSRAMPYGLASLLILNENATLASLLHGLYTAALNEISHSYGAGVEQIKEVY